MSVLVVNALLAGTLAALAVRLVRDHLARRPASAGEQDALLNARPEGVRAPGIKYVRGAWRTTQAAVSRWAAGGPGPLFRLCGTLLPAAAYLDKLIVLMGAPGTGKTAVVRLLIGELCRMAFVERSLGRRVRVLVIDPTDALRDAVWAHVPTDVPIHDLSVQSAGGLYWKISDDLRTEGEAATFAHDLTAESRARTSEVFWSSKVATAVRMVAVRFIRARADWRLSDLLAVLTYFRYLNPVLLSDPQLKTFVDNDMQGRLGRDVQASVTGVTDRMVTAAGFDQRAEEGLSNREFLALPEGVLYVRFREDLIASQGTLVAAQVKNLVTQALMRQVRKGSDRTLVVLDEGASLADVVPAVAAAARKGRGSGVGIVFTALGVNSLVTAFGDKPARELLSLAALTVCFHCDHDTAKALSDLAGDTEALVESRGKSEAHNHGHGGGAGGENWSEGWTHTDTTNTNLAVRKCVLPSELTNLPGPDAVTASGVVRGVAFSALTGAFPLEFDLDAEFAAQPPAPPRPPAPDRPDTPLRPLSRADLARLNLPLDPDGRMLDALREYGQT